MYMYSFLDSKILVTSQQFPEKHLQHPAEGLLSVDTNQAHDTRNMKSMDGGMVWTDLFRPEMTDSEQHQHSRG